MDLTERLLRAGVPHVFVVPVPGRTDVRLRVERELRERGWPDVPTPADADLLFVCGEFGGPLDEAQRRVWTQLPSPRSRASAAAVDDVAPALDAAYAGLQDFNAVRADAAGRADEEVPVDAVVPTTASAPAGHEGMAHAGMSHGGTGHGGSGHGPAGHGDAPDGGTAHAEAGHGGMGREGARPEADGHGRAGHEGRGAHSRHSGHAMVGHDAGEQGQPAPEGPSDGAPREAGAHGPAAHAGLAQDPAAMGHDDARQHADSHADAGRGAGGHGSEPLHSDVEHVEHEPPRPMKAETVSSREAAHEAAPRGPEGDDMTHAPPESGAPSRGHAQVLRSDAVAARPRVDDPDANAGDPADRGGAGKWGGDLAPPGSGESDATGQSAPKENGGMSHDQMGHGGMSHGQMGHGGGSHDHMGHGMGMELPGGLPMADRAPDRDGLKLDRITLVLGPALTDWPAGLVVRLGIQGDVAQTAEVEVLPAGAEGPSYWEAAAESAGADPAQLSAAAAADSLQRLLSVVGWRPAALAVRRLRDQLLDPEHYVDARSARWLRRVRRSRLLRWSTNGVGAVARPQAALLGADATERWTRWIDVIDAALPGNAHPSAPAPQPTPRRHHAQAVLAALPGLLIGAELASVRLTVASLDPDLEALASHVAAHE